MFYNEEGLRTEWKIYDFNNDLIQLYLTTYESGLISFEESYTNIRDNDLENSDYLKLIYLYK